MTMTKLVNRAKMTTATTGTGTITLGSAVDGYQTFANAGVANADIVRYVIEDGSAWEIGLGTYSSTGTTLTRGTIESSTGSAINLSGNATVFVTAAAGDLQELVTFAETFALPTADGTNGQVLTTNGSGTLTFTSPGASLTGQTDSATPFETSLGSGAGAVNTGVNNTFIGFEAGNDNTTGTNNVAVGFQALDVNTTGAGNVSVGNAALGALTTGSNNVAIGNGALDAATTGGRNIAIGQDAMGLGVATAASGDNVAIGFQAGYDLTSGVANVMIGDLAGSNFTTTNRSIAIGRNALSAMVSTSDAVAIGNSAGGTLTAGDSFVAIGVSAGRGTTMDDGVAIGAYSVGGGVNSSNSQGNVGVGYQALTRVSTGGFNVSVGYNSAAQLTTGVNNVAIGNGALDAATTGGENVAIGLDAGGGVSIATRTVFIGPSAGSNASNGMGIGYRAARYSSAESNTAVGNQALADTLLTGNTNSAFGYQALLNVESGNGNTGVGYVAGSNITTGSNNMVLGNLAQASSATVSNEITLGDSSITTLRCQVTTITSLSDARDKTDIQPLNAGLEFVEALNPVSFTWNMRDGGKVGVADTGFIAQDLQMAQEWAGVTIPGLVYDVNPDKLEAGYGKLIPVLVQAIKDLSAKVNLLEAQLEAQK